MDATMIAMEVTANLDGVGTVFTQLMTWMGELITTIAANPLLLISTGLFTAGGVIGLGKRVIG